MLLPQVYEWEMKLTFSVIMCDDTGVPGITQCTIRPGKSHVYQFRPTQAGTLWWHSHEGFQRRSVYGLIAIDHSTDTTRRVGPVTYDEERTLLVSDWFLGDGRRQLRSLLGAPAKWIGEPVTIMMNGRACIPVSGPLANHSHYSDGVLQNAPSLDVEPEKTYRLRIVGAATLTYLTMGIFDHNLTIVEAETSLVDPITVNAIDIGPGQSYSVILRTKSVTELKRSRSDGLFSIKFMARLRNCSISGVAFLQYRADSLKRSRSVPLPSEQDFPPPPFLPAIDDVEWSLSQARSLKSSSESRSSKDVNNEVPKNANRTIVIHSNEMTFSDGRVRWVVNNISFAVPGTPALHAVKFGLEDKDSFIGMSKGSVLAASEKMNFGTHILSVEVNEVVDFVFLQQRRTQNETLTSSPNEVHTW